MRNHTLFAAVVLTVALLSEPGFAQGPDPRDGFASADTGGAAFFEFDGRMQNLFLWRNDQDFDRTSPAYDAQGQEVGVLGTFIAPRLTIMPTDYIRLVWESELGLNIWSAQDPDQYKMGGEGSFRLAIRQLYAEGTYLDDQFRFRVGYEQLFDPTGLFLGHWLGAASVAWNFDGLVLTLTGAQIPDQTYEGASYDSNNFNSDTFAFGARADWAIGQHLGLSGSFWGLHDSQVVRQDLNLMTATLSLNGRWPWVSFAADAGVQFGKTEGRATDGDETTLAWAGQLSFDINEGLWDRGRNRLLVHLNFMVLSGDDDYDGKDFNGAWFYSGKSRSRTVIITEDELRDRGGNIDEAMAERRQGDNGKFYTLRPGLAVTDLTVGLDIEGFFRPMLTVGVGAALNATNSLGSNLAGLETDVHLEFYDDNLLSFDIVGSWLLPGEAASAFVNRSENREAVDSIFQTEAVLTVRF